MRVTQGTKTWVLTLAMSLVAGMLWAQEPVEDEESTPPAPPRVIRFRENPYENAYRSWQRPGQGYFGYQPARRFGARGGYPSASYYRNPRTGRPYRYSRFWGNPFSGRQRLGGGQNSELFLVTPILAPVGPLAEFLDR